MHAQPLLHAALAADRRQILVDQAAFSRVVARRGTDIPLRARLFEVLRFRGRRPAVPAGRPVARRYGTR